MKSGAPDCRQYLHIVLSSIIMEVPILYDNKSEDVRFHNSDCNMIGEIQVWSHRPLTLSLQHVYVEPEEVSLACVHCKRGH